MGKKGGLGVRLVSSFPLEDTVAQHSPVVSSPLIEFSAQKKRNGKRMRHGTKKASGKPKAFVLHVVCRGKEASEGIGKDELRLPAVLL